ncbi:uncharacterized protein LOC129767552 [Toxorhynchites rutilus septentrionalis]|uniref:uncharacterized protein LOC129767552 n=1 Tax=Toxorhynchites rutilus septentrionalis TaxID=329112 RepID=UPI002478C29B|nr:uncharacterized protein LOC129767552 [Toxorhynchites rutilus septentrionalis]XP_055624539.1 uncharacterized protein LOC129767552 [Toxorhynchites rutilus septentrionalis]XP_055624540.1 uncharacterized protein LOC129767552 [Toxorhynchites rutilus septentrionalis]XP_055624541.1 uncharacterized protein LOC129767552 [Toxorhynchites rutilus septentrionalis]XP_055624542.1 uncharacterized protein LOC129767552 [Toxorhynchites rutilus septentrionalis]XP_055624543.1 uncharacterized protein LOC12976755
MARNATCHRLSPMYQTMLISMALFILTELHSTAAHVWDPESSSVRRSNHNAPNSQNSNYSKNLPNHNINHGRTSRSSSYYNGGAGRSSNDLVRMGAAKSADWYEPSKNRYMYEHVQSGSITLPKGGRAFLEPDQNRTLAYAHHAPHTTVHRQKPARMHQRNRNHHQRHIDWPASRRSSDPSVKTTVVNGLCIKCPADKTAIARKGLDGVLIELPMLTTCRNQPISRDLYELETLFGAKFNFILPHSNGGGPFSFLAKVVNKRSGKIVQTCDLRYKVIVKQCGRYYPKNKDLKVTCDLGNIWGSKCTFHCKNDGYLSNQDAFVECGEDQSWEGVEPHCVYNDISDDYAYDSDTTPTSECSYLIPPNNGRFACELRSTVESSNDLYVPSGTICRIKCNDNHEIPAHLQAGSVFACHEGHWNSTMKHFCHKTGAGMHRKRRYG